MSSADPRTATLILGVASTFELLSASLICGQVWCYGDVLYAVLVGCVSLALLAPVALVLFAEPLAPPRLHEGLLHLSLLLLAWWVPAAFFLTFVGPFQGLCNGYFASVGGLVGAFQLCRAHVPPFELAVMQLQAIARGAPKERSLLVGLALTSTAVWVMAAVSLGQLGEEHPATKSWALIVGLVSFVMCAVYLFFDAATTHRLAFASMLALWWVQGVALSFVPTSFIGTINGFGATWASAALAFAFLRSNDITRELAPVPSAPPDDDGLGVPTTTYVAALDPPVDPSDGFSRSFDGMGSVSSAQVASAYASSSTWTSGPPPPPLPPAGPPSHDAL